MIQQHNNCSKNDAADLVRAGRLQSLGGNVQPSIGAKKAVEQDEVVIVHLRETSTETVLSLPSFITASDMREVSEAKAGQYPAVQIVLKLALVVKVNLYIYGEGRLLFAMILSQIVIFWFISTSAIIFPCPQN